jgi:hypothetical protein
MSQQVRSLQQAEMMLCCYGTTSGAGSELMLIKNFR